MFSNVSALRHCPPQSDTFCDIFHICLLLFSVLALSTVATHTRGIVPRRDCNSDSHRLAPLGMARWDEQDTYPKRFTLGRCFCNACIAQPGWRCSVSVVGVVGIVSVAGRRGHCGQCWRCRRCKCRGWCRRCACQVHEHLHTTKLTRYRYGTVS
jgi:hypothetical protein